jgi:hypothetical protein
VDPIARRSTTRVAATWDVERLHKGGIGSAW